MSSSLVTWWRRLFRPDGFRGPVLTLLSGSSVALLIAYLAQPVLTRLYAPEAFGVADYFVSLIILLMSVASLRFEDALMQPETDEEAAEVLWICIAVLCATVLLCTVLLPWRGALASWLGVPRIAPWLILIPPTLLFMRLWKLSEVWLTRYRRFAHVSAGQVVNTSTMVTARIAAGLIGSIGGAGGLIGGFLVGHVTASIVLLTTIKRMTGTVLRRAFAPARWWGVMARYRRYPLFSMPSTLLGALLGRLPFLLIPVFFDETVLGFFGRAFVALAIPLSFLGSAVARVFFVQAADAIQTDDLPRLTQTVHARLVMMGLFPTLALMIAGGDIFDFVFGDTWRTSGEFLVYLAPWLFLMNVASPLTRLFDVLERQRLDLLSSGCMFAILLAALYVGGQSGSVVLLLAALGIAGVLTRLGHLIVLLRLGHVSLRSALLAYGRYALFSGPGLLLITLAQHAERPWVTTLAATVGGLLYLGIVAWQDRLLPSAVRS